MKLLILVAIATVVQAVPQNWPYRDNVGYWGLQNRGYYRNVGSAEDDEVEFGRQDLKVGGQSPETPTTAIDAATTTTNNANSPVVVETGSAKPVATETANTKQANQPVKPSNNAAPVATQPATGASQPPAFPPATPPQPQTPEDSEEDSDEEEEADDDEDEEQDEEEEDSNEERRRSDVPKNVTENVVAKNEKTPVQTVEALVPGYVTEQGEVLVPFDTVVKGGEGAKVAVVEDPSYSVVPPGSKNAPPVVVLPSETEKPEQVFDPATRPVPKFFNPHGNKGLYYSEVPPPGSIFTFDDDNDVGEFESGRGRQDTSSEEEEEDTQDDDDSEQDDDASDEEDDAAERRPPLSLVKATAPSGEDDEAESLGLRISRHARGYHGDYDPRYYEFYGSRTPNYFYAGNGYYITRYPAPSPASRPSFYYRPSYDRHSNPMPPMYPIQSNAVFYYRPASSEKVKVVPIATFDVSLEEDVESGEMRPVVGYHGYPGYLGNRRVVMGRPVVRPAPAVKPRPVVVRRNGNKPGVVAIYNVEGGTPVARGRAVVRGQREAKDLKKKKKVKKVEDPLGLMKKVKKN